MTTTVATHDGPFHLDELIAIAALAEACGPLTITRIRNPDEIAAADIAVDVGGGAFDHHQPGGNGIRSNGIPYASAGLVWRTYGEGICGDADVARRVDERFIQSVDAADTGIDLLGPPNHPSGVRPITMQTVITWFNPVNKPPEDYDRAFHEALTIARTILKHAIEAARQSVDADRGIHAALDRWPQNRPFRLDELMAIAALDMAHHAAEPMHPRDTLGHYQPDSNDVRPNGIPYTSAGLVWRTYGEHICGDVDIARRVDERFIQSVDAAGAGIDLLGPPNHPSGVRPITLETVIAWFNSINTSPEEHDRAYHEALAIARAFLERAIEAARQSVDADRVIRAAIDRWKQSGSPAIIVFDRWAPGCVQAAATTSAIYALFPDIKAGWRVQAVPETPTSRTNRKSLPEHWRGLGSNALVKASGVHDTVFCHPSGFIAGAESFHSALMLALKALEHPNPLLAMWPDVFKRSWILSGWSMTYRKNRMVFRLCLDGIWFNFHEEAYESGYWLHMVETYEPPAADEQPIIIRPKPVIGTIKSGWHDDLVILTYNDTPVVEFGTDYYNPDYTNIFVKIDHQKLLTDDA